MDIRDKKALFEIRQKYGGSIKALSNSNTLRYKLNHQKGLISLIRHVNGNLRNPTRLLQINKLCLKYSIGLIYPNTMTYNNGWLSGFIDSEGLICFNQESGQMSISITQKNKYLLDPLVRLYNGRVEIGTSKESFKYVIYRKLDLFELINNYFKHYPLKTKKFKMISIIKQFYISIDKNNPDIKKLNS